MVDQLTSELSPGAQLHPDPEAKIVPPKPENTTKRVVEGGTWNPNGKNKTGGVYTKMVETGREQGLDGKGFIIQNFYRVDANGAVEMEQVKSYAPEPGDSARGDVIGDQTLKKVERGSMTGKVFESLDPETSKPIHTLLITEKRPPRQPQAAPSAKP